MGRPPEFGGFADVDGTGASLDYAAYLDRVRDLDAVGQWKERSFALLEPAPGAVLVDVGCGTGDDVLELARRVAPGGRAIGVDASATMIHEARRRAGGAGVAVEFRVADARGLGLPDSSVDGARTERTLQHVEHPDAVVAEMVRVVRAGGRIVVAEPDWDTLVVDPGDPLVGRAVRSAAVERVRSGIVGRRVRRLLVDAGLVEVGVVARTLVLTDLAQAELMLDLSGALARAVERGRVDAVDARAWRNDLARADAEGRHLTAMTAFMAWGRRRPLA